MSRDNELLLDAYKSLCPDDLPIGIYAVRMDGVFVAANRAAERLLHKSPLKGSSIRDFYQTPSDREARVSELRSCFAEGKPYSHTLDLIIEKRETHHVHDTAKIVMDGAREVGIVGFLVDITDQERARRLLDHVPSAVYIADADGIVRYASPGTARLFGAESAESLIGQSVAPLYENERDAAEFEERLRAAIEKDEPAVTVVLPFKRIDDRRKFYGLVEVRPFRGPGGRMPWREGVITDVTEREVLLRAIRALPGFYQLREQEGRFVVERCSSNFAKLFGYTPEEMTGVATADLTVDPEAYRNFENEVLASDSPSFEKRLEVHDRKWTRKFWISITCVPLKEDNRVVGRVGYVQDITAQLDVERELRRFQVDSNRLLHAFSNALIRIRTALPPLSRMLTRDLKLQVDADIPALLEEAVDDLVRHLRVLLEETTSSRAASRHEELRRCERLLSNREETAPFPELRPSLYREVAETVTAIVSQPADSTPADPAAELLAVCSRVIALVNRLALNDVTALSEYLDSELRLIRRRMSPAPEEVGKHDVEGIVRDVVHEWAEYASSNGVLIRIHSIPTRTIACNRHEMVLALGNLLHNAIKYSWTRRYHPREDRAEGLPRYVEIDGSQSTSETLILRIINLGVPIARDEMTRLFQPGFKGRFSRTHGRVGTGMGMSYAKEVVHRYNGSINVDSRPADRNAAEDSYDKPFLTTVTVRLPFAKEDDDADRSVD